MQLQIKATKPQAEFLQLPHKYRLFCAGYGAGKSEAMANAALIDACQSSDALIACYAPTYDLVRLITAPRIQAKLYEHGVPHKHNKAENVIYTSAPRWGDFVLRTMDNPERIVGYEAYASHADELDTLKFEHAENVWNKIVGRNRQRPSGMEDTINRVSAYTTPEGFRFAYHRWVLNKSDSYGMVQAPSYSNPFLPDDYVQSLRATYPEALVDAYIEGRFVNLATGTVYSSYSRATCHTDETIQPNERLYIGQDFNIGAMASVVYVRRGESMHAVDELVDLYDTPSLIDTIKQRYDGHQIVMYPDASGGSRKTVNASTSDIALLEQAGFAVRAPRKNPPVKDRIVSANRAFEGGLAKVNSKRCPEYVRCLEQQAFDKNGEPDKSGGLDHMNDAGTYPLAYEYPVRKPVSHIPISFAR